MRRGGGGAGVMRSRANEKEGKGVKTRRGGGEEKPDVP